MLASGEVCLRRLGGRRSEEVRFGRFLANPKVTVERIVAGWGIETGAAAAGRHVLAIQDTSEFNFPTTTARRRGLGEIGKGVGRGLLLHAMLGVDAASGDCLGLVCGTVWTRAGRREVEHTRRPLSDRESRRWIETPEAARAAGAEPVLWHLLTTHQVPDAAMAWMIVDWYRARWAIEQLFRVLKTQGLKAEGSQLADGERLCKLIAVAARAAAVTLQLVQARDGASRAPADHVFRPVETAALAALNPSLEGKTAKQRNPHPQGTLAWACWIVARLGGWDGYASSRKPGPITFKHGLDRLADIAQGLALKDVCMP